MSDTKDGQGNNSADSMNIPRLGEKPKGSAADAVAAAAKAAGKPREPATTQAPATGPTTLASLNQSSAPAPAPTPGEAFPATEEQEQAQAHVAEVAALNKLSDNDLIAEMNRRHAINNPANIRREREMHATNKPVKLTIPNIGDSIRDDMERPDLHLEPVDTINFESKAAALKFNEELLLIKIHGTNEKGAVNPVSLYVNGRGVHIWRDQPTWVKRKYVERLMRAKPEVLETQVTTKGNDMVNNVTRHSSLKYPFSILEDKNQSKGRAWEEKLLAEAQ